MRTVVLFKAVRSPRWYLSWRWDLEANKVVGPWVEIRPEGFFLGYGAYFHRLLYTPKRYREEIALARVRNTPQVDERTVITPGTNRSGWAGGILLWGPGSIEQTDYATRITTNGTWCVCFYYPSWNLMRRCQPSIIKKHEKKQYTVVAKSINHTSQPSPPVLFLFIKQTHASITFLLNYCSFYFTLVPTKNSELTTCYSTMYATHNVALWMVYVVRASQRNVSTNMPTVVL